jgi:uncharacterized membrane protein
VPVEEPSTATKPEVSAAWPRRCVTQLAFGCGRLVLFNGLPIRHILLMERQAGQLSLYFICAVFAALCLGYLAHNEWGISCHAIRVDALWIAAFVGTVWGAKSVFGKNAK